MSQKRLIWDLPTRLFHWLLAAGVIATFALAKLAGEHGRWFAVHQLIGLTLGLAIALRLIWALIGTRHARFSALIFSPAQVVTYLRGVLDGSGRRHVAHNPASAYAIVVMIALTIMVIASGMMRANGFKPAEEVHEIATYTLLAMAAVHVAGVVIHTRRFRENISLSMITGTKQADESDAIASPRLLSGVAFLFMVALFAGGVFANYDPATEKTRLPLVGTVIRLGEGEVGAHERSGSHRADHDDD
jgi:cytochrome b